MMTAGHVGGSSFHGFHIFVLDKSNSKTFWFLLQDRVAATELAILFPAKMQSRSSRCTPIELGLSKTSILILDDQKGRLAHHIESPIIPCPTVPRITQK